VTLLWPPHPQLAALSLVSPPSPWVTQVPLVDGDRGGAGMVNAFTLEIEVSVCLWRLS
jgi:hypothetical protein